MRTAPTCRTSLICERCLTNPDRHVGWRPVETREGRDKGGSVMDLPFDVHPLTDHDREIYVGGVLGGLGLACGDGRRGPPGRRRAAGEEHQSMSEARREARPREPQRELERRLMPGPSPTLVQKSSGLYPAEHELEKDGMTRARAADRPTFTCEECRSSFWRACSYHRPRVCARDCYLTAVRRDWWSVQRVPLATNRGLGNGSDRTAADRDARRVRSRI